ncbi:MAG: SHOCT domain-containing protein [Bacilli bacterium]|nr:SHOCT domain-containing protein [Bacilli bacterium]
METKTKQDITKEFAIENAISTAIQIPGVKVNRDQFLAETFATEKNIKIQDVLDNGPIKAGATREQLLNISTKLILKRTSQSSIASFVAGIPGGLAMAATIPADILQFFGMALRLAQEISYLYGADDLWNKGEVDEQKIQSQLVLYCGVMFGVSGAVSGVRVLSTQIAKTTLKKLPQKALTKTFWYPIVRSIGKAIGVKVTKTTVAKGVSKAVPILGGVISGTLNFASMMPMANRLQKTFDDATFEYTEDELNKDLTIIESIDENTDLSKESDENELKSLGKKTTDNIKQLGNNISGMFKKEKKQNTTDPYEELKKLKELLDMDVITQEEFDKKKKELLNL